MRTRVRLLRHAQTVDPTVFHGLESDVGLSELGQRRANALANVLANEPTNAVISSAMRRAIQTATPIARACGVDLRIEPMLHERKFGILTGVPKNPEPPLWSETLQNWIAGNTAFTTPEAESFDEVRNRILPVWERITDEWAGGSLIIVAHGLVCHVLLMSILPEWPVSRWREFGSVANLSVSDLIKENGTWSAVSRSVVPQIVSNTP